MVAGVAEQAGRETVGGAAPSAAQPGAAWPFTS
jgi:hypothetical protein